MTAAVPLVLFGLQAVLTGLDGQRQTFESTGRKATVILFVSTVCPVSGDYLPRIEQLWADYGRHDGVRMLVVFPNKTESLADVRRYASELRVPFPVYRDEGNVLADALRAAVTPTAVVVDREGNTVYIGAIDDAVNPARVKRAYVREAIEAALAGRALADSVQTAQGCTIKRVRR